MDAVTRRGVLGGTAAGLALPYLPANAETPPPVPADAGKVAINGDDLYAAMAAYRSIVGYVPQDDTLHRSLPVARAQFDGAIGFRRGAIREVGMVDVLFLQRLQGDAGLA